MYLCADDIWQESWTEWDVEVAPPFDTLYLRGDGTLQKLEAVPVEHGDLHTDAGAYPE